MALGSKATTISCQGLQGSHRRLHNPLGTRSLNLVLAFIACGKITKLTVESTIPKCALRLIMVEKPAYIHRITRHARPTVWG